MSHAELEDPPPSQDQELVEEEARHMERVKEATAKYPNLPKLRVRRTLQPRQSHQWIYFARRILVELDSVVQRFHASGRTAFGDELQANIVSLLTLPQRAIAAPKQKKKSASEDTAARNGANAPEAAARRAVGKLFIDHSLHKATQALKQTQLKDLRKKSVRDSLRAKFPHPPADARMPFPPQASQDYHVDITTDMIRKANAHLALKNAQDMYGWSHVHLRYILRDEISATALCSLLALIANNTLPANLKHLFTAKTLLGAPKKDPDDARPIGIPSVFLTTVNTALLRNFGPARNLAKFFLPNPRIQQYGGSSTGGTQTIIHAANAIAASSEESIIISIDMRNGFNRVNRAEIVRAMQKDTDARPLVNAFRFSYADPIDMLMIDPETRDITDVISAKEGTVQGCSLGGMGFNYRLQPYIVDSVIGSKAKSTAVHAYFDNITWSSLSFEEGIKAADHFLEKAPRDLQTNTGDSWVLWPHDSPVPKRVRTWAADCKLRLFVGWAPLLGAVVGALHVGKFAEQARRWLLQKVKNALQPLQDLLLHPTLPRHVAWHILKYSVQPILTHLMRTVRPDVLAPACKHFDRISRRLVLRLADVRPDQDGLPYPQITKTFVDLHTKHGGLGIHQTHGDLAHTAYLAGAADTATYLVGLLPQVLNEPDNPYSNYIKNDVYQRLAEVRTDLLERFNPEPLTFPNGKPSPVSYDMLLPPTGDDLWNFYARTLPDHIAGLPSETRRGGAKLQRMLSAMCQTRTGCQLPQDIKASTLLPYTERMLAHLNAVRAPGADTIIRDFPHGMAELVKNRAFAYFLRMRLPVLAVRLPGITADNPGACLCSKMQLPVLPGHHVGAPRNIAFTQDHVVADPAFTGRHLKAKHDALRDAMILEGHALGVTPGCEVTLGTGCRVDFTLNTRNAHDNQLCLGIDVRVTNPTASTNIPHEVKAINGSLEAAEIEKTKHNQASAEAAGYNYSSFILSVYGGEHKSVDYVLQYLAVHATHHFPQEYPTKASFKRPIRRRIHALLHNANAKAVDDITIEIQRHNNRPIRLDQLTVYPPWVDAPQGDQPPAPAAAPAATDPSVPGDAFPDVSTSGPDGHGPPVGGLAEDAPRPSDSPTPPVSPAPSDPDSPAHGVDAPANGDTQDDVDALDKAVQTDSDDFSDTAPTGSQRDASRVFSDGIRSLSRGIRPEPPSPKKSRKRGAPRARGGRGGRGGGGRGRGTGRPRGRPRKVPGATADAAAINVRRGGVRRQAPKRARRTGGVYANRDRLVAEASPMHQAPSRPQRVRRPPPCGSARSTNAAASSTCVDDGVRPAGPASAAPAARSHSSSCLGNDRHCTCRRD